MNTNWSVEYMQNNTVAKLRANLYELSSFVIFSKLYLSGKGGPIYPLGILIIENILRFLINAYKI